MAARAAAAAATPGLLLLPFLLLAAASGAANDAAGSTPPISRKSFPEGFVFGTASSAYQVEKRSSLLFVHMQLCKSFPRRLSIPFPRLKEHACMPQEPGRQVRERKLQKALAYSTA